MARQSRPRHIVDDKTRATVSALKSYGLRNEEVAEYLGISPDTLERRYAHEIKTARVTANAKVAAKLFKKAVEQEELAAIIFWLKTQARWREKDKEDDTTTKQFASIIEQLIADKKL